METSSLTRIVVYGAAGRMGRSILAASCRWPQIEVAAALVRASSVLVDQPVPELACVGLADPLYQARLDPELAFDVLIDFSAGAAFDNALALAVQRGAALVSGTTGLGPEQRHNLRQAALQIPVLWSANFSLGVALLQRLVGEAARGLGPEFVVEIIEAHHRHKQDAPSGTAIALGQTVASARGQNFEQVAMLARTELGGTRRPGEIGFSSLRGGDIVGEHSVWFIAEGERIEISHRASSRELFSRGALRAAEWIKGREPALYTIEQVIAG